MRGHTTRRYKRNYKLKQEKSCPWALAKVTCTMCSLYAVVRLWTNRYGKAVWWLDKSAFCHGRTGVAISKDLPCEWSSDGLDINKHQVNFFAIFGQDGICPWQVHFLAHFCPLDGGPSYIGAILSFYRGYLVVLPQQLILLYGCRLLQGHRQCSKDHVPLCCPSAYFIVSAEIFFLVEAVFCIAKPQQGSRVRLTVGIYSVAYKYMW